MPSTLANFPAVARVVPVNSSDFACTEDIAVAFLVIGNGRLIRRFEPSLGIASHGGQHCALLDAKYEAEAFVAGMSAAKNLVRRSTQQETCGCSASKM